MNKQKKSAKPEYNKKLYQQQYIVFGAGKFGTSVALTLEEEGCEVMVVDKDAEKIQEISSKVSHAVCLNIEDAESFAGLGLKNVDGVVVAMTENLEASIVTVMLCSEAGVPRIFAKARNATHEKILKSVGAHRIIFPERDMGQRVARHIVADNFIDWIDISQEYSLVEIQIPSAWEGKTLRDLKLRERLQLNLIGYKTTDSVQINPDPAAPLPAGVTLIVIGQNATIEQLS